MVKHLTWILSLTVMSALLGWGIDAATAGNQPLTIAKVMQEAHKRGLLKKVANGQASDAEKARLLTLYKALAANRPPMGDANSWQVKTSALVAAAQQAANGNPGAGAALQRTANCKGCHSVHK